jgi:filamentous hemagglutinin family protein
MSRLLPLIALFLAGPLCLEANPTGGAVAAGSATIAGQGSSAVTINQASNTAIINWQTFSIGSGELTKFIQPSSSSATLNRVLGGQTSFINGTLSANGQVYLINGNGIIVGAGGVISTAGFTGSTRDISDSDFLSGNLHFIGSSDAGVQNLGAISALGGNVVLIGKTVDNEGSINASGTAALAAGDDVLLAQMNPDGSTVTVNPVSSPSAASTKVGVKNGGTIKASAAELKAANGNIYALAIQNNGLIQATTVTHQGGHIYLTADSGTIFNSGTLNASATVAKGVGGSVLLKSTAGKVVHSGTIIAQGGQGGAGGKVEISGKQVALTGTVDTTSPGGTTGSLLLDPSQLDVITGGGADPTASTVDPATVDSLLDENNLTLTADNGITISNAVAWDSGNTLILQTNDTGSTLHINAPITATSDAASTGTPNGGLVIDLASAADVASTSSAGAVDVASFDLERGAWVQVNGTLPGFAATDDFEIGDGTFLRASGGNGSTGSPYVLTDVYGLQGVGGFLGSSFTSDGNVIDASVTANWNDGAGFVPIGGSDTPFTGTLTNVSVDNLTVSPPDGDDVGLVGVLGETGVLNNVSVQDSSISGAHDVGGVVGENDGELEVVSFDGNVGGSSADEESTNDNLGGLVGYNSQTGTIAYSFFGGTVTPDGGADTHNVGGIAGENDGHITYSHTLPGASVTGDYDVGGIAGYNIGFIQDSYNSGSVSSREDFGQNFNAGGIAGENDSADGDSVPPNSGVIQECYNTGAIDGEEVLGGIVGLNDAGGEVNTCYNTGTIGFEAATVAGGIVGDNFGVVTKTYSSGLVLGGDGTNEVAGITGFDENGATTTDSYWDTSTTGQSTPTTFYSGDSDLPNEANLGAVSTTDGGELVLASAYSVVGNNGGEGTDGNPGAGYAYFGAATPVPGARGLYAIGVSPDDDMSPAWYILEGETRPILSQELAAVPGGPTQSQIFSTFEAEIGSLQNQFGNDPFNGLNSLFFLILPNGYTVGGDLAGAVNTKRNGRDFAHASSTVNLPSFSRLITSDTGVVEIIGGAVVIGDPATGKPIFLNTPGTSLSQEAMLDLKSTLSPNVYNELLAIIHGE